MERNEHDRTEVAEHRDEHDRTDVIDRRDDEARDAPRQWWMPEPNVIWGAGCLRVMSNVSGSVIAFGSKLAAVSPMATSVPLGNRTSRYSMSSDEMRAVPRTAPR